jgi:hypothetical protein
MSSTDHKKYLKDHCRVCLQKLGRVHYACSNEQCSSLFKSCLAIDTALDKSSVHPPCICNNCYAKMKKIQGGSGLPLVVFPFTEHSENCVLCNHFDTLQKGGRPKKNRQITQSTREHLQSCAGPNLACAELSHTSLSLPQDPFHSLICSVPFVNVL